MAPGETRSLRAAAHRVAARIKRGPTMPEKDETDVDERGIAVPPADLRGIVGGAEAVAEWLSGGAQDAGLIRAMVERDHGPMSAMTSVLDFGCGCGRVARWWGDLAGPHVFGSDYDPAMTAWCQANLPWMTVSTNGPEPPLPFDPDSFDLVYAISLFTHLTVSAQAAWMSDVARVLKPGGVVLFTTHGEIFTNQLTAEQRQAYGAGEVVVRNSEVNGAQACSSFDPPTFVAERLLPAAGLELVRATPGDWAEGQIWTAMVLQDKYLARKSLE
jgi:SAM-dependent methyltransferase